MLFLFTTFGNWKKSQFEFFFVSGYTRSRAVYYDCRAFCGSNFVIGFSHNIDFLYPYFVANTITSLEPLQYCQIGTTHVLSSKLLSSRNTKNDCSVHAWEPMIGPMLLNLRSLLRKIYGQSQRRCLPVIVNDNTSVTQKENYQLLRGWCCHFLLQVEQIYNGIETTVVGKRLKDKPLVLQCKSYT